MKIFKFFKKGFFTGLTILSNLTGVNSLTCISMTNKECKVRQEIVNVNSDEPVQNCVFLMFLKILMSKYFI